MSRVQAFWGLSADPFAARNAPFVATAVHAEAVARLLHAVGAGDPRVSLRADEGLGKTAVLDRVAEALRGSAVRAIRVHGGDELAGAILDSLAPGPRGRAEGSATWPRLVDAARVLRFQKKALLVLVDDAHRLDVANRAVLSRLTHLDAHPEARIVVVDAGREEPESAGEPWSLAVRLRPLTSSESTGYLADKLLAAGRSQVVFTDRAIVRLHALSGGVPRALDRLASLAMLAGAARGLEVLPPEVIDGVAAECLGPIAA